MDDLHHALPDIETKDELELVLIILFRATPSWAFLIGLKG